MPSHLQREVDLILDVFDDVAFDSRVITGFQRVPETRRPVKVNTLESGTERDISHSFQGGKVELTGKNCTLLQCQTYQCSSGTPLDPWFSVDKEAKV